MSVIKVENLRKNFPLQVEGNLLTKVKSRLANRQFEAVKDIDFEVKKKDFFGLLGSNGAGKTVTLSCISTLLIPDSGSIQVNDVDIIKNPFYFRENANIVLSDRLVYSKLNVKENLQFYSRLYGLGIQETKSRVNSIIKEFNFGEISSKKIEDLSNGQKQRVAIARALVNEPSILLLDEPTVGIDANFQIELHDLFRELNKTKTLLLTSHYLHEVELLCNKVIVMKKGIIIAKGSPDEIISKTKKKGCIKLEFNKISSAKIKELLPKNAVISGCNATLLESKPEIIAIDLVRSIPKKYLKSIEVKKPSLEQAFIELTGEEKENECGENTNALGGDEVNENA